MITTQACCPLCGHKILELDNKKLILKRGLGIKSKKLWEQVRDQKVWKQVTDGA